MHNILGKHRLRAVAAAAAVLTLMATPSAGTTQNAGTTHNHDAHGGAQETLDCQLEEGVQVVTLEGLTTTLPQPVTPNGQERTRFVLDLGEVPAGTTAKVTAAMSWRIQASDWDLSMEDAAGTELDRSWDYQPVMPPVEQVSDLRPHCEVFTLVSINAVQVVPTPDAVDSLDTVITVTNVPPPPSPHEILDCQPEEGAQVVTLEGLTTTLPQPMSPSPQERTQFVLDLGEVPAGTTATVTATMSWTIEANDWDLRMEDAEEAVLSRSVDFQPGDPPVEQLSAFERPHCGLFTLVSINASGVAMPEAVDSLDTVIRVTDVGAPAISLQDCHMTLHLFRDSAERLSAWLPDRSRYTTVGTVHGRPDQAFLAFWFYSCGDVSIDGGPSRATNLSLVAIVVKPPEGWGPVRPYDPLGDAPVSSDHYLVWAHTDNGKLAKHLQGVGMPVERVGSIEFQRPNEFDAFSSVVSSEGSYSASMSGHRDDFEHWHSNVFWHDNARLGESQLQIHIGSADDWYCDYLVTHPIIADDPTVPPCGRVSAEPGSEVASLLGGSTRETLAAFNHVELDAYGSLIPDPSGPRREGR